LAPEPIPEAFDTPGGPPWGTDYIWVDGDPKTLASVTFNGMDYSTFPTAWSSDGNVLFGGTGDLIDNWAIFETPGGGTLSFDTQYDIEEGWDFGFIQVSTDGGQTWTSLANAYTTDVHDPSAHPKVVENLPGLSGHSGGWINMSFDLGGYAGQDILVAFRYVTDWAFTEDGWFVDNVYVDGTLISDGSSTDPFVDITELNPVNNDFMVIFVGFRDMGTDNLFGIVRLRLDELTEEGMSELSQLLNGSDSVIMMVTFEAPEGYSQYADYTYEFNFNDGGPRRR